jgi:hypothetical protein
MKFVRVNPNSCDARSVDAEHAAGGCKLLLVKESWRSKNRIAEVEFLKAAKGLRGVGQMIAYEEGDIYRIYEGC